MIDRYRYPLRFYVYSAVIPWVLWFIAAYLSHQDNLLINDVAVSALGLAGLCAPLLVVFYFLRHDRGLLADVAARFVNFRAANAVYWVVALILMPASILLAMAISLLFGYDLNQFSIPGHASFTSGVLPVWVMLVVAPILEELAWHSYGTDSLRQKYTLFTTSMIFAIYWALWHLPLAAIKGYYHSNLAVDGAIYSLNFMVSIFPFVLLMNWLYYKTDRNILVAIILHLSANVFNEIFATHPDSKLIQTMLLLAVTAYVLAKDSDYFFKTNHLEQRAGSSQQALIMPNR